MSDSSGKFYVLYNNSLITLGHPTVEAAMGALKKYAGPKVKL